MKKTTKPADSATQFTQWLASMPADVRPNQLVALNFKVELFTTGWIDISAIAKRMNWTLEETINELLQHCSECFQHEEWRLLRHLGADDDRITAALAAVNLSDRAQLTP